MIFFQDILRQHVTSIKKLIFDSLGSRCSQYLGYGIAIDENLIGKTVPNLTHTPTDVEDVVAQIFNAQGRYFGLEMLLFYRLLPCQLQFCSFTATFMHYCSFHFFWVFQFRNGSFYQLLLLFVAAYITCKCFF